MFTSSILSACLEGHIISDNMPDSSVEFTNFRVLDPESSGLDSSYLYIGRSRDLYEVSKKKWDKDQLYTIVVTDGDDVMDIFTDSRSFRIVITDMRLNSVINSISELADEYNRVFSLKRHLTGTVGVADPLIEGAARSMNADCFYLTARFRTVSCFKTVHCPEFQYLEPGEHLNAKDLTMLRDEWTTYGDWTARICPIEHEDSVNAYLLVVMKKNSRERFNSDMLLLLKSCLSEFIGQVFSDRSVTSGRFTRLAQDIIEGNINTQEALTERLRGLDSVPEGYYYLIVIETERVLDTLPAKIFPAVGALFADAFPVQYENKLILMIPSDDGSELSKQDEASLLDILKEYRLYACIGSLTMSLRSLRAAYLRVSKCLSFARTFRSDRKKRIFRAEEYALYDVIDICCNALADQYHGDTIHLCNRGVLSLSNYDRIHGTNYSQLLKAYLQNNMNTSRTAEDFGLHRNTLMYKLRKIEQLTGENLSDPMISLRMLFSLYTIDYLSVYQNRSIIESEATAKILEDNR